MAGPPNEARSRGWRKAENNFVPAGLRTVMALALPAGGEGRSDRGAGILANRPQRVAQTSEGLVGCYTKQVTSYVQFLVSCLGYLWYLGRISDPRASM
jgi:hypothetical protein